MSNVNSTAERVEGIFCTYLQRAPSGIDMYASTGRNRLLDRIKGFVQRDEPVSIVMPGFPAKSPNTDSKVFGELPDGSEEAAFYQFNRFSRSIGEVYSPGAQVHITSDGYVHASILGVSDKSLAEYEAECKRMTEGMSIKWHNLLSFYPELSREDAVTTLMEEFGMKPEELDRLIEEDPEFGILYNGMHRFMQNDIKWPLEWSKNRIKKEAKPIAKEVMRRGDAYTKLVEYAFPDSVRVSCHPGVNDGTKYSWQFLPGNTGWGSPWHNVLHIDEKGQQSFIHKKDIEAEGFEVVEHNGRPYFSRVKGSDVGIEDLEMLVTF